MDNSCKIPVFKVEYQAQYFFRFYFQGKSEFTHLKFCNTDRISEFNIFNENL